MIPEITVQLDVWQSKPRASGDDPVTWVDGVTDIR